MKQKIFRLEDLFTLNRGRIINKQYIEKHKGTYPVCSSALNNYGIMGYINTYDYNCLALTWGTDSSEFKPLLRNGKFSITNVCGVMLPKSHKWSEDSLLYLIGATSGSSKQYSWSDKASMEKISETQVLLPYNANTYPAIDYMKQIIKSEFGSINQSINQSIKGMETYSEIIGKLVCAMSKLDTSTWKEYTLDELFEKIECKKLPYKAKDLYKEPKGDCIGAITATVSNNGIAGYVPKEGATILQNVITVSANGQSGRMFYQPESCTILQDAYALKPKDFDLDEDIALFLIAVMQKLTAKGYDWNNKAGWNKIKHLKVKVPVEEIEEPDFDFMEKYIRAIKKLVIKDLVEWKDKEIEATREIINR